MSAGRVVVIDNGRHSNVLGAVLQSSMGSGNTRTFSILLICDKGDNNPAVAGEATPNDNRPVKPFTARQLFVPESVCWHRVVEAKASDISVITTRSLKLEAEKIIKDIRKREQPRFRSVPS